MSYLSWQWWQREPRWQCVVPVLFLDYLIIAMPRAVVPAMLDEQMGREAYTALGRAEMAKGTLTFLVAPALGALSDAVGRKGLFIVAVLGTAAPSVSLAFSRDMHSYLVLVGLSGALAATFPLAFAYIADLVPPAQRAASYGATVGLSLGLAFLIGPMLAALIERAASRQAVFDLCVWVAVASLLLTLAFMREAPKAAHPARDELLRRANPCAAFHLLRRRHYLRSLALIDCKRRRRRTP